MLAKDLISDVGPALKTSDTGLDALNWMEVFRISHLPIVNNQQFLGLISDSDIYDQNRVDWPIGEHALSLSFPFVYDYQHIYDVIEVAARLKLSGIPVVDAEKRYLGLITQSNLIWHFNRIVAASTPGGIIELELKPHDYTLSELARIVEDADAKVLSLYVAQDEQDQNYHVVMKINAVELGSIRRSFERFGYNIRVISSQDEALDDKIKNNYDAFLRYLDI